MSRDRLFVLTVGTAIAVYVVVEVAVVARPRRELQRGRCRLVERAMRGGVGGHSHARARRQVERRWRREAKRGAETRQRHPWAGGGRGLSAEEGEPASGKMARSMEWRTQIKQKVKILQGEKKGEIVSRNRPRRALPLVADAEPRLKHRNGFSNRPE